MVGTGVLVGTGVAVGVGVLVGVGVGAITVTVTDLVTEPPGPVQTSVNVVVCVRLPVNAVPLIGLTPVQPPEAVQVLVLVEVQLSVESPLVVTVVGLAVRVSVGGRGVGVRVGVGLGVDVGVGVGQADVEIVKYPPVLGLKSPKVVLPA